MRVRFNDVSTAFLPANEPIVGLTEVSSLAKALNQLVRKLPDLIRERTLRKQIDKLNRQYPAEILSVNRQNSRCLNASMMVLLMLAQGYIFEDPANTSTELPAILSENILLLCQYANRLPVNTYADYVLNNWRLIDKLEPISLENIQPLFTFTGSEDEAWFIKIHVAVEAACNNALIAARCALRGGHSVEKLIELHELIANALNEARTVLLRMKEHCCPDYFYYSLRPYLNGWETVRKVVNNQEEVGIRFKRFDGTNEREFLRCYRGMSGAQSGIVPAFDAFLNVKQDKDHMQEVLQAFQAYMPAKDRELIALMGTSLIHTELMSDDRLLVARKQAIDQLTLFRIGHMSLVHQFVYQVAGKEGIASETIKGTGGTLTDEYLGKRTVTTKQVAASLETMRAKL